VVNKEILPKSPKGLRIKGLKFLIQGKLKGKPRSKSFLYTVGRIPVQTVTANIDFAKSHVFTIYGVFGMKLWIFK